MFILCFEHGSLSSRSCSSPPALFGLLFIVLLLLLQVMTVLEDLQLHVPIGFSDVDVPRTQQRYIVDVQADHGTLQLQRYLHLQFSNITRDGVVVGEEEFFDDLIVSSKGSAITAADLLRLGTPDDVITPPATRLRDFNLQQERIELEFSHHVRFEGRLEDCNTALGSLFYRGDLNWNSANKDKDHVVVTVTEVLAAGRGSRTTDVRHIYIDVVSVNDAPVVHVPGALLLSAVASWRSSSPSFRSCVSTRLRFVSLRSSFVRCRLCWTCTRAGAELPHVR